MNHPLDALIARNTGFTSMADMLNASGNYRPTCCVADKAMLEIADAYDAEQAKRGDPRRAFRYGDPYQPELVRKPAGRVWVNQAKRTAHVVATNDTHALIVYTMPNGRDYYWEVPIDITWAELRNDGYGQHVRNINQTRPPKRWAAAIAEELGE